VIERELKPGWKIWRFDQMATNVNVRIDNPSESGMAHYVGLAHLDPDSLRIRRWGSPDEVEATKLIFKKGDIIFARRRAYQRKLGVAEFDGICSAHAMVLRAKPEVVLPEFLPFFMQSDLFMSRAVEISVGSLSPTINWKSMAMQEFALPPIEGQRQILEALQATESTCIAHADALDSAILARAAFVEDFLSKTYDQRRVMELGASLLDLRYGSSSRSSYEETGYPILRIPNVLRGQIDYSDLQHIKLSDTEYERLALHKGDVLIVRTNGNPHYVGRSVVIDKIKQKTVFASYLIRIRCDVDLLRPAFLAEFLNAPTTRQRLRGEVKSSAGNYNLNIAGIRKQPICLPNPSKQDEAISILAKMDSAKAEIEHRLESTRSMKKQMLAKIWEAS
jgi:restriction endonuclease S subunit